MIKSNARFFKSAYAMLNAVRGNTAKDLYLFTLNKLERWLIS